MDFNMQCDTRAAAIVARSAELRLVTLPASAQAQVRTADLPRLRAAGQIGELLATQSETYAADNGMAELGHSCRGLPDDLVNFQWDPVTCAVAVGWSGIRVQEIRLGVKMEGEVLRFSESPGGRLTRAVVDIDAVEFRELWLRSIEAAGAVR